MDDSLTSRPNIGPAVAQRLNAVGIRTVSELAQVGPVEAFRRMRAQPGPPPTLRHHLYGLDAALRGLRVQDLPRARRTRLARQALALPVDAEAPSFWVRSKRVVRARRRR